MYMHSIIQVDRYWSYSEPSHRCINPVVHRQNTNSINDSFATTFETETRPLYVLGTVNYKSTTDGYSISHWPAESHPAIHPGQVLPEGPINVRLSLLQTKISAILADTPAICHNGEFVAVLIRFS